VLVVAYYAFAGTTIVCKKDLQHSTKDQQGIAVIKRNRMYSQRVADLQTHRVANEPSLIVADIALFD